METVELVNDAEVRVTVAASEVEAYRESGFAPLLEREDTSSHGTFTAAADEKYIERPARLPFQAAGEVAITTDASGQTVAVEDGRRPT